MGTDVRPLEVASCEAFLALVRAKDRGERRRGYAFSIEADVRGSYPTTTLVVEARYGTEDEIAWRWELPLWEPGPSGDLELLELPQDWWLTLNNMAEDLGYPNLFPRKRPAAP